MSFKDNSATSVKSLLALLRTTQGQEGSVAPSQQQSQPQLQSQASSSLDPTSRPSALTHTRTPPNPITSAQIPSQQQLNTLLASLQSSQVPQQPSISQSEYDPASHSFSAPYDSQPSFPSDIRRPPPHPSSSTSTSDPNVNRAKEKRNRRDEPGFQIMPFSKALPIITELLADESFTQELKRMRADQDALERRLWAKEEKLKAEHENSIQAERDIAKITRRPIPREKQEQWTQNLSLALDDFHRQSCLPAVDGLAFRQKQRLEELGVPGLGGDVGDDGDNSRAKVRVGRIMDVLQGGLED